MLDLLDWKSRSQVTQRVREQLQAGALGAATMVIEDFVAQSRDDDLVQAACIAAETADLDWIGVCAEAIEADHRLRSLQETGCRLVDLELGNQPESRLNVIRHYYGPARVPVEGRSERTERRLGAYHGILDELMSATGLEQLAEVQLRPWPRGPEEQQIEQRSLAGRSQRGCLPMYSIASFLSKM